MEYAISKKNGYIIVELPSKHETIIDEDDEWILKTFPCWRVHVSGGRATAVMVTRYIKTEYGTVREDRYLHRVVMHRMRTRLLKCIDHRDRNPLNNRKSNLRWVTPKQNILNSPKRSRVFTSKHRGVYRNNYIKSERWIAQIKVNGKTRHLGSFRTEKDAALAYNKASEKIYGEYGWLNSI